MPEALVKTWLPPHPQGIDNMLIDVDDVELPLVIYDLLFQHLVDARTRLGQRGAAGESHASEAQGEGRRVLYHLVAETITSLLTVIYYHR